MKNACKADILFFSLSFPMNIKKKVASLILGSMALAMAVGVNASVNASFDGVQAVHTAVVAVVDFVSPSQASALTSSGGVVTIDQTDLDLADDSVNNLLKTVFEILKLLPIIALILAMPSRLESIAAPS